METEATPSVKLSEKGKIHLTRDEGSKTNAYQDTRGIWTIGIGFTQLNGAPVKATDVLTVKEITDLLPEVLKPYEEAVKLSVSCKLFQHEFDSLVCFCFNIGAAGFTNSKVVDSLNKGNKLLAVADMFQWRNPPEILKRRYNDARLFAIGEYLK